MSSSFLLFQLYGPMASWGEIAVGEVRSTADHPTKSAVLGMVAAALGITREQEEEQQHLANAYGFSVRLDAPGSLLRDFHSAQVSTGVGGSDLPTRRDELEYANQTTILSERDYRCDAFYTICLWSREDTTKWSLDEVAEALDTPEFALFLGRKSCPLALPLNPRVLRAKSLREAFEAFPTDSNVIGRLRHEDAMIRIYWDARDKDIETGLERSQTHERWDHSRSRKRWQFGRRTEAYATIEPASSKERS